MGWGENVVGGLRSLRVGSGRVKILDGMVDAMRLGEEMNIPL